MKICIISFSGRANGNCSAISASREKTVLISVIWRSLCWKR